MALVSWGLKTFMLEGLADPEGPAIFPPHGLAFECLPTLPLVFSDSWMGGESLGDEEVAGSWVGVKGGWLCSEI